jgi:NitT/TauT family transport system substrate-binding protein
VSAIRSTLPVFTVDGVMPADGPATVERVLKAFNPNLRHATVDLAETCTTEFTENAR